VPSARSVGAVGDREHRALHDEINQLLAILNRGISAHVLTDAHIDHAKAAEVAAELGAFFLHHAFIHGHVDVPPDPPRRGAE
jgi:hypothetical protein